MEDKKEAPPLADLLNASDTKLVEVYTDKFGNKWYTNLNPFDISAVRGIAAARKERYVGMMLSETTLKELLEEHRMAAKELDIRKCFAIVQEIANRQAFICEEDSILDLVDIYYFLNEEEPETISDFHSAEKRKIWLEDPACKNFFLKVGMALTNRLANIPESDLLKYLSDTATIALRVKDLLRKD